MVYLPSYFIFDSEKAKYGMAEDAENSGGVTQLGREMGIRRLMSIGLLKRLESSVYAFRQTLERVLAQIRKTIAAIDRYDQLGEIGLFEFVDLGCGNIGTSDFNDCRYYSGI